MSQTTLQTQALSTSPSTHRSSCQDLLLLRILPIALAIIGLTSALMAYYHVYYSISVCVTILSWTSVTALISRLAVLTLKPVKNVPRLPDDIFAPVDLIPLTAPKFVDRHMKCLKLPVIPLITHYTTDYVTYPERLVSVQLPKERLEKFPSSVHSRLKTDATDYELYAIALNDHKVEGIHRNIFLHPLFFENLSSFKEQQIFPEVLVVEPSNISPCAGEDSIPLVDWMSTDVCVHPRDSQLAFSPDNLKFTIEKLDQPSSFFVGAYDPLSGKGYGCFIYLLHQAECPITTLLSHSSEYQNPKDFCDFFHIQHQQHLSCNHLEEGSCDPNLKKFFELIDPTASVHS